MPNEKKYIDADLVLKTLSDLMPSHTTPDGSEINAVEIQSAQEMIVQASISVYGMPAADVSEVRHGRWRNCYLDYTLAECSECKEMFDVCSEETATAELFDVFKRFYKFCPNCGARMDGENNG